VPVGAFHDVADACDVVGWNNVETDVATSYHSRESFGEQLRIVELNDPVRVSLGAIHPRAGHPLRNEPPLEASIGRQ
jgi:hypothetical protein